MSEVTIQKGHPKGLYVLFATEFWERFSYYGMRAIFVLFMTEKLLFDKAYASNIYGSYTGLVYLTPLIGGYMADRYWGNRKSIFVGGSLMALGQFLLFTCASFPQGSGMAPILLWTGLAFLIFGNGFFKPNISTMVGQLYPETANSKKDSAYTIFYMGINAGAFLAPLVCGYLGEKVDFKWGFLAAGLGMLISLVIFYFTKDKYVVSYTGEPLGVKPNKLKDSPISETGKSGFSSTQIITLIICIIAAWCLMHFVLKVDIWGSAIYGMTLCLPFAILTDRSLSKTEKDRLWVIVIIMLFVIFFWMCFEQAGASLTFFANEQTDRHIFGWEMPASYFQSFNAGFIVLLAPIFAVLWGKLAKRGIEPPAPLKQSMGLGLLALGFLFIAFGTTGDPLVKVSIWWLTGLYFLHTVGELFLSPIGLSMVNKLAPGRFTSLMMGIWFMAIATGNKLAGTMSALYPDPKATGPRPVFLGITIDNLHTYFMLFVGFAGVASVILFLLSFKLRKMMHGIK
jgi:proton-dependent oligopeptide transporter, POT family